MTTPLSDERLAEIRRYVMYEGPTDLGHVIGTALTAPELLAEVERLRARVAALEGVLRSVEWVECVDGVGRLYGQCPSCQENEPRHAPDCALDAALREASDDDE